MIRSNIAALACAASLFVAVACGDDDGGNGGTTDAASDDDEDAAPTADAAPDPDAAPPDAAPTYALQPALGIDNLDLVGRNMLFGLLGAQFANEQLDDMIAAGELLFALELRDLDDPSGQQDDAVTVGFYRGIDPDEPGNNFDAENPGTWIADPTTQTKTGEPLVTLDGSSTGGHLVAQSDGMIVVPAGPIDVPLYRPRVEGVLVAAPDDSSVHFLENGTVGKGEEVVAMLTGTVPGSLLAMAPNFAAGDPLNCAGNSALDLLALGCGPFLEGVQPDDDLDGDGLETYHDTCPTPVGGVEPDAAVDDGIISCCVDGDGAIIAGADCPADARMADGYIMDFELHATRIELVSQIAPGGR
jgi:hypothetical protein